jgi:2-deoxystreptamine N-acetyl-D-glucosaminyltransferase/2-deoxystreptamine glucosyltransferase
VSTLFEDPLRVAVLTTSYPRDPNDVSGRFVADAVERLRAEGVDMTVVSPELPGEGTVIAKLRRRPWLLPGLVYRAVRALRRTDAEIVHAHWLLAGAVAVLAGKPFVLTLHGSGSAGPLSDLALARRLPRVVGAIVRRAQVVIAVSDPLAEAARRCGARDVRVIPNGIAIPDELEASSGTEVLYAGRLSPEKGIEELAAACAGLDLTVVGDGPLRALVPHTLGFLPPDELSRLYARAAVIVCPSRSEGFGVVCAEAMAHGRPVVATAVGGLAALIRHEETGLLVEPGDPAALRAAIDRLLADPLLRRRLGGAARADVAARFAWPAVIAATMAAYGTAAGRPDLAVTPARRRRAA